jgi:hypothetical protein
MTKLKSFGSKYIFFRRPSKEFFVFARVRKLKKKMQENGYLTYVRDVRNGLVQSFRPLKFQRKDNLMLVQTDKYWLCFGRHHVSHVEDGDFISLEKLFEASGAVDDILDESMWHICRQELAQRDEDDWSFFGPGMFVMTFKHGNAWWVDFCPHSIILTKSTDRENHCDVWLLQAQPQAEN